MGCPECSYPYWYIFLLRGTPIFILEVRTTHPMVIFIGPGFRERDPIFHWNIDLFLLYTHAVRKITRKDEGRGYLPWFIGVTWNSSRPLHLADEIPLLFMLRRDCPLAVVKVDLHVFFYEAWQFEGRGTVFFDWSSWRSCTHVLRLVMSRTGGNGRTPAS